MRIVNYVMIFAALSIFMVSCNNEMAENQVQNVAQQSQEVIYINPSELQFFIEPTSLVEENGIPKTSIILASKGRENIVLAEDYNYTPIEAAKYATYQIPEQAIFAFSSYFAGAGNNYYGILESMQLKIYKQSVEAESEAAESFEPFKSYAFTENETIEL